MSLKKKNEEEQAKKRLEFLDKLNIKMNFVVEVERNYPQISYMNIHRFMDVLGIARYVFKKIINDYPDTAFGMGKLGQLVYDVDRDLNELHDTFQTLLLEEYDPTAVELDINGVMGMHSKLAQKIEEMCILVGISEADSLIGKSIMYMQHIPSQNSVSVPIFY